MKGIPTTLGRWLDPPKRYGARIILFALAIVLLFGPLGLLVTQLTTTDPGLNDLDISTAEAFHPLVTDSPGLVVGLEVISFIGSPPWFYLPARWCVHLPLDQASPSHCDLHRGDGTGGRARRHRGEVLG